MKEIFQLGEDEEILWSGRPSSNTVWRGAACNQILPFALGWLVIQVFIVEDSWKDLLDHSPLLFLFGYLLPVWLYLIKFYLLLRAGAGARYCVTDRAVYTRYKGVIMSKPLSEICAVKYEKGRFTDFNDVGTVRCIYRKLNGRVPDESEEKNYSLTLRMADDYRYVGKRIEDLCRAAEKSALKQRVREQTAAARTEVPVRMLEAINEAKQPEPLQEDTAPPECPQTLVQEGDPDAAFFGMPHSFRGTQQKTFLDPAPLPDQAVAAMLPDASVTELQAELFGAEPEQSGDSAGKMTQDGF